MKVADRLRELVSSRRFDSRAGLIGGSFGIVAVAAVMFALAVPPVLSAPAGPNATGFFWEGSTSSSNAVQGGATSGAYSSSDDTNASGTNALSEIPSVSQTFIPGPSSSVQGPVNDASAAEASLTAQSSDGSVEEARATSEDVGNWLIQMQDTVLALRVCFLNDLAALGVEIDFDNEWETWSAARRDKYKPVQDDVCSHLMEVFDCMNLTWPDSAEYPEHAETMQNLHKALDDLEAGARIMIDFVDDYWNGWVVMTEDGGGAWTPRDESTKSGILSHLVHGAAGTSHDLSLDSLESAWHTVMG